jgi:hypothetical protein
MSVQSGLNADINKKDEKKCAGHVRKNGNLSCPAKYPAKNYVLTSDEFALERR